MNNKAVNEPIICIAPTPEAREDLMGSWDSIVESSTTLVESWLGTILAILAAFSIIVYSKITDFGWNHIQIIVAALFVFDLVGGVIFKTTTTIKRYYNSSENGLGYQLVFVMSHIHPLIAAWLFQRREWMYFWLIYIYMLVRVILILTSPPQLQQPVATLSYMGSSLLLNGYVSAPSFGLECFVPIYFHKLLETYTKL